MSTKLAEDYDLEQGALTVLVEDCQDPNDSEHKLKLFLPKLFGESELLYLDEPCVSGQELFERISKEINMGAVKMPDPKRILLCYYARLNSLCEKWTELFFERARELRELAAPAEMEHIIVFYYEQAYRLGDSKERVIAQLMKLGDSSQGIIRRKVYLLWKAGFTTLDAQEQGLVQLLHMCSRRRRPRASTSSTYGIRSLCYADYYEDRAKQCKQIIDKCGCWIKEEGDTGFTRFAASIKTVIDRINARMQEEERSFRKMVSLFPVSVKDYKRGFLSLGYQRDINDDDPRIRKRKEEFLQEMKTRIIQETEADEVLGFVRKSFHYPDLERLSAKLWESRFEEWFLKESYVVGNWPDREIVHGVIERIRALLLPYINERDALLEQKKQNIRMARREQEQIGNYNSLQEFTENVMNRLLPVNVREFTPRIRDSFVLVSGNCKNEIEFGGLSVKGAMDVYYYPAINPREIAVLRECDFLTFDETDAAANSLGRMFGD